MLEKEKALKDFSEGFNCSQAVLKAFSDKLQFDEGFAASVALGFGGGMGRTQKTCGAVTGAYMALGIYNDRMHIQLNDKKNCTYEMIQNFNNKFLEKNKSLDCIELLGCSLLTEEGRSTYKENNLDENVCQKCISDSIKILNKMI